VGGTADTSTGLTNEGAREYDAQTASFISPDSVLIPTVPQDLNPYAYAADNPSTDSDPSGLCMESWCPPPPAHGSNPHPATSGPGHYTGDNSCEDWLPGCPGFTGGGAGQGGETLYGSGSGHTSHLPVDHKRPTGSQEELLADMTESCGSAGFRFGASACPTKADHGAPWQATFHDLEHYYDVINNGMNELGGHLYIQGAVCFLICISLSLQGNDFIFSFQEFSISRLWRRVDASDEEWEGFKNKASGYAGVTAGFNSATVGETVHNNRVVGACGGDGLGGCVGATGYEGAKGLGPVRPYVAIGPALGIQGEGGATQSWDISQELDRYLSRVW
jgi:RHS repeat-associated protein